MTQKRRGGGFLAAHGIPLFLLVASLLLISISNRTILTFPGKIAATVAGSVQYTFSAVSGVVKRSVFAIRELADLRNQYEALAAKLESYEILERDFAEMRAENNRLKDQLGFSQNAVSIVASAQIIAKDPGNIYSSYVIDKGQRTGIRDDLAVSAYQNGTEGLVGKILSVRTSNSLVLPMFDQRFYVSARLSRTRTEGLVNGRGNPEDLLEMRYVSKLNAQEIQIGDLVVTSGYDSIYPANLVIGRVKQIELPEYSSSATILLEPALDFSKLEYLFILEKTTAGEADMPLQKGGQ